MTIRGEEEVELTLEVLQRIGILDRKLNAVHIWAGASIIYRNSGDPMFAIATDRRISQAAIGVWIYTLLARAEHHGSRSNIRERFGMDEDRFERVWSELLRYGYVTQLPTGQHLIIRETPVACPVH
jgi:hypothetical protein